MRSLRSWNRYNRWYTRCLVQLSKFLNSRQTSCLFLQTFIANSDRFTVVAHNLKPPIKARYIRIIPEEWNSYIALRVEFYGCKTSECSFDHAYIQQKLKLILALFLAFKKRGKHEHHSTIKLYNFSGCYSRGLWQTFTHLCCLSYYICKWLDPLVFSDKEDKP